MKGFKKPRREPWISPEDIEAHKDRKMTVRDLARKYWELPYIIRKWLKEAGVKTSGRAYKVSQLTHDDVRQYRIGELSVSDLADRYEVSVQVIYRWLRSAGIKRGKGVVHTKCPLTRNELDRYEQGKISINDFARKYNVACTVVKKWLFNKGIEMRRPKSKTRLDDRNSRIVEMLKTHNLGEVARKFKISKQRAHQIFREACGANLKDIRSRHVNKDHAEKSSAGTG